MTITAARLFRCLPIAFACCAFAPALALAQGQQFATVSAVLNKTALRPGDDAVVAVVLEVKAGYHAQSHNPGNDNLIKTEITLDAPPPPPLTFGGTIYPPGHT